MNGAEVMLATLADNGVDVCFANPGTSEMQLVAAFDREPRVRPVLCLFEGVVTGAADGYARMAGKPAATLLHLGSGLSNGSANLHNARRAFSPVVNIVGDHATYHRTLDAPLTSDIEGLAGPVSVQVNAAEHADDVARLTLEAIHASQAGVPGPATLIMPADCAWSDARADAPALLPYVRRSPPRERIESIAEALKKARNPILLLGTTAMSEDGLAFAGRIAQTGVKIFMDTFVARQPRGEGRFAPERLPYFGEAALASLQGVDLMVLVSTKAPVAFFGYPGLPSILVPEGCTVDMLSQPDEDAETALGMLAEILADDQQSITVELKVDAASPEGQLSAATIGISMARHLPADTIVAEDAVSSGLPIYPPTRSARRHDWLFLTGGAIGIGIPLAIGAAIARPKQKVLCLSGDGAAAYALQGLWTVAHEKLDITIVIFANRAYRILDLELARTRSGVAGTRARSLLSLADPATDWTAIAAGFGIPAIRCQTAEDFDAAFAQAMKERGPRLIEAVILP